MGRHRVLHVKDNMKKLNKTFTFSNNTFNILEKDLKGVYINIKRLIKTNPYEGMKQPCPPGAMMGAEAVLELKYQGKPVSWMWKLKKNRRIIQKDKTDEHGFSRGLDICMPYPHNNLTKYSITISLNIDDAIKE